jgi:RHS repeat-associated protein
MNPHLSPRSGQLPLSHNHARYDGDGNRVEKSGENLYWYGAGTEILDETDTFGDFTNEYVFFGGKHVAMKYFGKAGVTIYYYEEDMLGSSRTMVQAGQTSVCYDADFYPFGGERDITVSCTQNYKFEGKIRDPETGDDDFGARYYTSRLGRWLSADWSSTPAPVPYANLTNPQTLNLYAMVSDNPETFADLDGHCQPGDTATSSACASSPGQSGGSLGQQSSDKVTEKPAGVVDAQSLTQKVLQAAKTALDWFNNNLGFGFGNEKSNCAGGGSCADALTMATGAVVAGVASGGESEMEEAPAIGKQIAEAAKKFDNLAEQLDKNTLEAAKREVNGGMKVAKPGGGYYDHAAKVGNAARGVTRQLKHLERLVGRSGLSESHVQTINGLIERGRSMLQTAIAAITKDPA